MKTLRQPDAIRAACRAAAATGRLGFVPTMGALHEGHLSLVRRARAECDTVAVSIFVNPLQFGPQEDLDAYPRPEAQDAELLRGARADLLLLLREADMYPAGFATAIRQDGSTALYEGHARPGHFEGVLTVVAKLLNLVAPARAYFGRKDYQQTVVVRRMVTDLDMPTEIVVCDTVRDADGLALSSRNAYLSADERRAGLSLVAALARAEELFEQGERSGPRLAAELRRVLTEGVGREPDYAAVVAPDDLAARDVVQAGDVALVAAPVGPARLLDNHVLGTPLRHPPHEA